MADAGVSIVLQPVGDFLVVPIQGPVNRDMLEALAGELLDYLANHYPSAVIFDMAGIKVLDLHDFDNLRGLAETAQLIGAPVVFAGIQPGVAAGLTMLDADTSWIKTALNADQAMSRLQ